MNPGFHFFFPFSFMDDNFISIALKNLPKGKTGLSGSKGSTDQWELSSDGTFKIETYKTIQQTETLSGTKNRKSCYNINI